MLEMAEGVLVAWCLVVCAPRPAHASSAVPAVEESTASLEEPSMDQPSAAEESDTQDIIPPTGVGVLGSSMPVTPVTTYPQKTGYEDARDQLVQALTLWNAGNAEAASDMALEAYDNLSQIRRVRGVKRSKIRAEIRQAAELYVEASIKTINNFVQRAGRSPDTLQEARERLEDLRDVARDYHSLTAMLNQALQQMSGS